MADPYSWTGAFLVLGGFMLSLLMRRRLWPGVMWIAGYSVFAVGMAQKHHRTDAVLSLTVAAVFAAIILTDAHLERRHVCKEQDKGQGNGGLPEEDGSPED